jgi:hypothetical protein
MIRDLQASNNRPALSMRVSLCHSHPRGDDSFPAGMPIHSLCQNSYMCEPPDEASAPVDAHSNPRALVSCPRNIELWGACIRGNGLMCAFCSILLQCEVSNTRTNVKHFFPGWLSVMFVIDCSSETVETVVSGCVCQKNEQRAFLTCQRNAIDGTSES